MSETTGQHYCSACGEQHGGRGGKDPEVEIARIQAERDIRVAEIGRGEAKAVTEVQAETAVAVTELEAEAAVAVAEATDPPPADEGDEENQAIIVEGPPVEQDVEEEPSIEPKEENLPEPESSRGGGGYWG